MAPPSWGLPRGGGRGGEEVDEEEASQLPLMLYRVILGSSVDTVHSSVYVVIGWPRS